MQIKATLISLNFQIRDIIKLYKIVCVWRREDIYFKD